MRKILKFLAIGAVGLSMAATAAIPAQAGGGGPTIGGQLGQVAYCLDAMFNDVDTYLAECQSGPGYSGSPKHKLKSLPSCVEIRGRGARTQTELPKKVDCFWGDWRPTD